MNDIQLRVNLNVFRLLCVVWVCLTVLLAIPSVEVIPELKTLWASIGGYLLTIFTSFKDVVTNNKES